MNVAKVEYIYEDENGTEYRAEETQLEEEDMEQQGAEIQEVMIIEQHQESFDPEGTSTHVHETVSEKDPDCKRRGNIMSEDVNYVATHMLSSQQTSDELFAINIYTSRYPGIDKTKLSVMSFLISDENSHHCWGIPQSLKLIESMKLYKEELVNASNRRDVWRKIHKDVISKGLTVSIQECQNKWKNLIRSYKECTKMKNKDNMRFRYYKEMSDYFGGEKFFHMDHDYNKSKLTLMPLLSSGGTTTIGGSNSKVVPTVTFPPICFTDRQFMEYTNMKREEYSARQKRHEEEMNLRRQELEVQKKKLEVMKKAAMANLQGTKTVNFGRKRKATNNINNNSNEEAEIYEVVEQEQPQHIEILTNLAF